MTEPKAVKPKPLAAFKPEANMEQLITHAIDKNVAVETMEKLLAMRRELKAEWAREQFHQALADFQSECPIIKNDTIVRNKGGSERYRYATLDSILKQVRQLLRKHGFAYKTNAVVEGTCVTATCVAIHNQGHTEESSFMVPIDKEAFMNEPQMFASALTFAKRYAFRNAFGILTGDLDDDATAARSHTEEAAAEGHAPEGAKHRRTRAYEEEQPATGGKPLTEVLELSAWLKANNIPEGFVLAILKEKKMVPPQLTKLGNAPPGVIRRTLGSRERLLKAFEASSASPNGEDKPKAKPPAQPDPADQRAWEMREPITGLDSIELLGREGHEDWREIKIHFGKQKGTALGKLTGKSLVWWIQNWKPEKFKGNWKDPDLILDAALCLAHKEMDAASQQQQGGNYPFGGGE